MFTAKLRPFKSDVHALIDGVDVTKEGWADQLRASILESARKHQTARALDVPQFANQIAKLMLANNAARAKKLVNVLEDISLTYVTHHLIKLAILLVKLGLLAGFVVLVIWGYSRCTGT